MDEGGIPFLIGALIVCLMLEIIVEIMKAYFAEMQNLLLEMYVF